MPADHAGQLFRKGAVRTWDWQLRYYELHEGNDSEDEEEETEEEKEDAEAESIACPCLRAPIVAERRERGMMRDNMLCCDSA